MAYANFPPAGYLSSGDRTDAQMQTALEQWRTACQHTTGHGQCQLNYVNGNQIVLLPYGGNRMLLHNLGYSIPSVGLVLNNQGWVNTLLWIFLTDYSGNLTDVKLVPVIPPPPATPWGHYRHPESGHEIATYSGAGAEGYALVGIMYTGGDGLFKPDRTVSLFNRRMRAFGEHITQSFNFGNGQPGISIIQMVRVGFTGDTIAINAVIDAVGGATATLVTAILYFDGFATNHHCTARFDVYEEKTMSLVGWHTFATDSRVVIDLVLYVHSGPVQISISTGIQTTGTM